MPCHRPSVVLVMSRTVLENPLANVHSPYTSPRSNR